MAPLISRWAGGIVWVLGPSPANVLMHAQAAAARNTVGFSLLWSPTGERVGDLFAEYPFPRRMHPAVAWGTSIACQIAADAAGVTMTRERPVIEPGTNGGLRVRAHASLRRCHYPRSPLSFAVAMSCSTLARTCSLIASSVVS